MTGPFSFFMYTLFTWSILSLCIMIAALWFDYKVKKVFWGVITSVGTILAIFPAIAITAWMFKANPSNTIPIWNENKVYFRDETAKELPLILGYHEFSSIGDMEGDGKCYKNISVGDLGPGSVAIFIIGNNQVVAKVNEDKTTATELDYMFTVGKVREERTVPLIELNLSDFTECSTFKQQYVYDTLSKD